LPNATDRDTYEKIKTTPPKVDSNPHVFAWFSLVEKFTDAIRAQWGAAAGGKA
jgi:hypothetical protein